MFIVPYDFALDGFVGHDNCNNRRRSNTPFIQNVLSFIITPFLYLGARQVWRMH
jgi:hypothetical protein